VHLPIQRVEHNTRLGWKGGHYRLRHPLVPIVMVSDADVPEGTLDRADDHVRKSGGSKVLLGTPSETRQAASSKSDGLT
jgi:hypothetical protein